MHPDERDEVSPKLLPPGPAQQDVLPVSRPAFQEDETQMAHHKHNVAGGVRLRTACRGVCVCVCVCMRVIMWSFAIST